MKGIFIVLLLAATCIGCSDTVSPQRESATSVVAVPPPPPPPFLPDHQGAAMQSALASGPGTCAEDVPHIKVLPMKGLLGVDKHFDRIVVHAADYKDCLFQMVLDATPIIDPGQGPKRHPYALGDLAYDLLSRTNSISYGDCVSPDVMRKVEVSGSLVVYEWINSAGNRQQLHSCLMANSNI